MANRVAAFSLQRNSHLSSPSTNNAETSSVAGLKVRTFFSFVQGTLLNMGQTTILIETGGQYRYFCRQELLWIVAKCEQPEFSCALTSYSTTEFRPSTCQAWSIECKSESGSTWSSTCTSSEATGRERGFGGRFI